MDDLRDHTRSLLSGRMRAPETVMRLDRMGASFATRLSFMRTLMRRLHREKAVVKRRLWDMDADGYGRAVYTVTIARHAYSLVCFAHHLDPANRTDRVIAEQWDATFTLYDGIPTTADMDRLAANVPLQEAGRVGPRELVLSRANKSARLFDAVVDALSAGQQPDLRQLFETGYLMRTTAVYGNGKFGLADRAALADRDGLTGAFQVEMLAVWLIRGFTHDLAEHVARARAPDTAVALSDDHKRALGIGNSTGLGMAPFVIAHPELIHAWVSARESALALVRALPVASRDEIAAFGTTLAKAQDHVAAWIVPDPLQMTRIRELRGDLTALAALIRTGTLSGPNPWERLYQTAQAYGLEAQECLVALMLEPYGALIDDLAQGMQADTPARLNAGMTVAGLCALIKLRYHWALQVDFRAPAASRQFWYVSEDKAEPRLGLRTEERGADLELPLDVARQVQGLVQALVARATDEPLAFLLTARPDLRHVVERIQTCASHPFGEVQGNLICATCRPIDLLRFKLAFFGATRFDPKSDRWTRITLCQGAPLAAEIASADPDGWAFYAPPAAG